MEYKGGKQGATFIDLLALMFIGFRLAGIIDWPWWLVLMPIWVSAAAVFVSAAFGKDR